MQTQRSHMGLNSFTADALIDEAVGVAEIVSEFLTACLGYGTEDLSLAKPRLYAMNARAFEATQFVLSQAHNSTLEIEHFLLEYFPHHDPYTLFFKEAEIDVDNGVLYASYDAEKEAIVPLARHNKRKVSKVAA